MKLYYKDELLCKVEIKDTVKSALVLDMGKEEFLKQLAKEIYEGGVIDIDFLKNYDILISELCYRGFDEKEVRIDE